MRSLFKTIFLAGTIAFLGVACNSNTSENSSESETTEESAAQGKEYTSKYVCPMHCEGSGSDEPGLCPVCGMDYVLNENYSGNSGDSAAMEAGHEHHDHETHEHNHE